jgi:hypothetical protein
MSEAHGVTEADGTREFRYVTGPERLSEFEDLIWINSHSGQRQFPF